MGFWGTFGASSMALAQLGSLAIISGPDTLVVAGVAHDTTYSNFSFKPKYIIFKKTVLFKCKQNNLSSHGVECHECQVYVTSDLSFTQTIRKL